MGTPYRECPNCGAHLDAGEPCDCTHKERDPRPEAEPEKPLQRMRLMVVCREVDKETGKIAVYPLKMEIDDHVMQCLQIGRGQTRNCDISPLCPRAGSVTGT